MSKIFVLDTSVIIYDHSAIMHFDEHDIGIPITVLEELDNFKKGNDTKNFQAREFTRLIDELSKDHLLSNWIPLNGKTKGKFKVLMEVIPKINTESVFGRQKADHKILNAALSLQQQHKNREVILVTKDINLRLKAKSLNLIAEDYETGKVKSLKDLTTGVDVVEKIKKSVIDKLYRQGAVEREMVFDKKPQANQYFILKSTGNSILAFYDSKNDMICRVAKQTAYGISPRNAEQAFAMHAIMDPSIKLITIRGVAGSGKTLMALAGALQSRRNFKQIFLARPIVPLSNKDIGYLPGDIKSKLNPYMEPLWDNLKFIQNQFKEGDKDGDRINDMIVKEKLIIQPLAYIRGRSLSNIFFIVDEAQNLTPHEVKTIITRAGENTKIVFTGDVNQIDTPYLDATSNGLAYLINQIKDHPLYAHITLQKGERSELANLANELL